MNKKKTISKLTRLVPLAVVLSLMLVLIGIETDAQAALYNTHYYKKITIDHTKVSGSDQTNFPVLISLTGLNQSHINSGGSDIRFTAADGVTELPREIESYSGGNLTAWVKVPTLSATVDTVVYMYYGDATLTEPAANSPYGKNSVWDNNFKMVQHMNDATSTTVSDSTSNNNTGSKKNGVAQNTGKIGNGQALSAANHYIDFGNSSSLKFNGGGNFTYSLWMNLQGWDSVGNEWRNYVLAVTSGGDPEGAPGNVSKGMYLRLVRNGSGASDGYYQFCAGTGNTGYGSTWVGSWISTGTVNLNTWKYVTVEVDGNTQRLFVDGTQIGTATMPSKSLDSSSVYLGASEWDYPANVWTDEVRVSNTARSAGWVMTEFNNQNSPGTFSSAGSEVTLPDSVPPVVTKVTRSSGNIVLTYSEALLGTSVPANGDFAVTVNGSAYAVTNVAINSNQVTLTLASSLSRTDTANVSYTPGASPLLDLAGNQAAAFTNRLVDLGNNVYYTDNGNSTSTLTVNTWGITSSQYKDSPTSWTDSPSGNTPTYSNYQWIANNNYYNNSSGMYLSITTPVIDLSGSSNPELTFAHRYDFYSGTNPQSGVVQISTNGGTNWTELTHFTGGTQTDWQWVNLNLSAYKTNNVKIRFFSVAYSTSNDGWYIDDIRVGESGLSVSANTPADSATNVAVSGSMVVTFDRLMNVSTINSANFTVKDSLNNQVPGTFNIYDGYTFYFTPSQNMVYNAVYTATITTAIKADDGSTLANPYIWTFTTSDVDTAAPTGSIVINNNNASSRLSNVTIRATISDNSSGVGYVQLSNSTDFTGAAWVPYNPGAPWVAYADFPWKMATTDNVVHETGTKTVYARFKDYDGNISGTVSDTISYDSNTTYFVDDAEGTAQMNAASPWGKVDFYSHTGTHSWADTPDGNYAQNQNWGSYIQYNTNPNTSYWTIPSQVPVKVVSTPVLDLSQSTRPYLTFWQRYDFASAGNWDQAYGVVQISTDAGSYWTELGHFTGSQSSWQAVNYDLSAYKSSTVKIRFFVATAWATPKDGWYLDDIRVGEPNPSVLSTSIANGTTNVPVNTSVYATFDSAVDPAFLNTSTFTLKDAGENQISGTFSISGNTVTFQPSGNLAYSTTYTAIVTTDVMSVSGYHVDKAYSWSFTTMPPDNDPPVGSVTINNNAGTTSSIYATLNISATDTNSGVAQMQFADTDGPWTGVPWVNYGTTYMWRLPAGDGTKTVYARFKDVQGNVSSTVYGTIYYDSFGIDPVNPWSLTKRVTLTGMVEPGSTVSITTDSLTPGGTATVTGSTWSYTINDLTAGDNHITVTATKGGVTRPSKTVNINFIPYYYDYMENPQKSLYYGGSGRTDQTVYSGVYAWTDSPGGNYSNWDRKWLRTGLFSVAVAVKPMIYYKYKTTLADANDYLTVVIDRYGDASYLYSIQNGAWKISTTNSQWTEGVVDISGWDLYDKGANKRLRFRFDSNGSGTSDGVYVDNIVVAEANDTTVPVVSSFKINNDAVSTMSTAVTLSIAATDSTPGITNGYPTEMQFSDDGVYWSPWESYDISKDWQLTRTSGTKYVYARFKDVAGNVSATVYKTISLDVTPPVVVLDAVPASVTTNSYTISGTASDANPVTVKIDTNTAASDGYATVTGSSPNFTWSYKITNLVDGANNVTITTTDAGGNVADLINTTVNLDTTGDNNKPTGSLNIVNSAVGTKSRNVTLKPFAVDNAGGDSGVTWMQFSNTSDFSDGVAWTVYASTYQWTLTPGEGNKTVYARFADAKGYLDAAHVSDTVSATIYMDTTAPTLTIDPVISPINSFSETITGTFSDFNPVTIQVFSNTRSYVYSSGPLTGNIWSYTIPNNNVNGMVYGDNVFNVVATDAVGNVSSRNVTINSFKTYYYNDANDSALAIVNGTWGRSTSVYSSSPYGWALNPSGTYPPNSTYNTGTGIGDNVFTTSPAVDLTGTNNAYLSFKTKGSVSSGDSVGGYDWMTYGYSMLWSWSYGTWDWTQYGLRLNSYAGGAAKPANWNLRFALGSNSDANVGSFYVDDIKIYELETYPPAVTSVFPVENATNVPVNISDITATFSESMGSVSKNLTGTNVNFDGSGVHHLDYNTTYTATVNGSDPQGNTLPTKTWTFTTEKDTYPPTGTIQINSGAARTNWPFVNLTLTGTDPNYGTPSLSMRFSNDGVNWSSWEPFMTTRNQWRVSDGDGIKTVYVQFKDASGNISFPPKAIKSTIELDMTPPALTINPVSSPTNVISQTVSGNVSDLNLSSTVSIATDTAASDGTATPSGGSWSYNITGLVQGANVVTVTATDTAGNSTQVSATINVDTGRPTVTSVSPVNNAITVPLDSTISATFSKPMNPSTVNTNNFTLRDSSGVPVAGTINYSGNTFTFTPNSSMVVDTVYTATISTGVQDSVGNGLANAYTWSFRTLDNVAPTVSSSYPVNNAVYVQVYDRMTVTFSENIQPGANYAGVTLTNNSDGTVVEATYSISGKVLTIYPNIYLNNNTGYTVNIPAGAVTDMSGNPLAGPHSFSFTTALTNPATVPFTVVSGGTDHSVAIRGDGSVVSWGANDSGQLGDNSLENKTSPVLVRKDDSGTPWFKDVKAVSAGSTHTVALRQDGTVWSWGKNTNGQLGLGSGTADTAYPFGRLIPVQSQSVINTFVYDNGNPGAAAWSHTDTTQADFSAGTVSNAVYTTGGDLELPHTGGPYLGFNGSTDGINLSSSFSTANTFSYEFWVKPEATHEIDGQSNSSTSGTSGQKFAIGAQHRGSDSGAGVSIGTNGVSVYEHGDGYMPPLLVHDMSSTPITDWVHIAIVYNNKTPSLYINGQFIKTGLTSTRPNVYPSNTIGYGPYGYLQGKMRDVRIWNYARSAAQIQADMNSTLTGTESGLIGYWKLDEGSGTTVYDKTSGNRNGTFTGTPTWGSNLTYASPGTFTSDVLNLSSAGTAYDSTVSWTASVPGSTALTVSTNLYLNGSWQGWQTAANGGPIPGLTSGTNLTGAQLQYRVNLSTSNTAVTPRLSDLTITIRPYYSRTDTVRNGWFNQGWLYRRAVKIDHTKVDADLTNFPALISLTGLSYINANGTDIRFTASDGVTELPREIESYSGGNLLAWVKVPTLSATVDTTVYMYYGNSSAVEPAANSPYGKQAVWDSNYKMVQHMSDATTSTITDSTSNANNGTKVGANEPLTTTGSINNAQSFDGSNDRITVGQQSITGAGTFQAIIKRNASATNVIFNNENIGSLWPNYQLSVASDKAKFDFYSSSSVANVVTGTTTLGTTGYYFITGTYDMSNLKIYVNGQLENTTPTTNTPNNINNNYSIGATQTTSGYSTFSSMILDELRISNIARSASWIKTEYNNQLNAAAFVYMSPQESVFLPITSTTAPLDISQAGFAGNSLITWNPEQLQATYARPSVSYKMDSVPVAKDEPTYEIGRFGQGITVGNEALNVVFNVNTNNPDGNSYIAYDMTNVTDYTVQTGDYLEYDIREPMDIGTKYVSLAFRTESWDKFSWDGTLKDQNNYDASPWQDISLYGAGKWYHRKISLASWVGKTITKWDLMSEWDLVGTTQSQFGRIVITDGGSTVRKNIWSPGDPLPTLANDFQSDTSNGQTVTVSKISAQTLSVNANLSPKGGTIEQWVEVTDAAKELKGASDNNRIFQVWRGDGTVTGLSLFHDGTTANWNLYAKNDSAASSTVQVADSVTPNGWHLFGVTWSDAGVQLYIDGVKQGSAIASSYLPSSFQNKVYLGSVGNGTGYLNSVIDDFRLSSVARTADEVYSDYANGVSLPMDIYTTAKYNFDKTLQQNTTGSVFSRSTVSYNPDGSQAAVDQPLFGVGKFGQAVSVNEGALSLQYNMISAPDAYLKVELQPRKYYQWDPILSANGPKNYMVYPGSYLQYDIFWPSAGAANKKIAVDLTTNTGAKLSTSGAVDQNGVSAAPGVDLSAYASGKWYHRKILLDSMVNQYIYNYYLTSEYDAGGTVKALVRDIVITDAVGNRRYTVWYNYDPIPPLTTASTSDSGQTYSFTKVAPESLNVPVALSTKAGTVEEWVYVNDMVPMPTGKNVRALQLMRGDGIYDGLLVWYASTTNTWRFRARNDANVMYTSVIDAVYVPNGWNHFALTWGTSGVRLYINGQQRGEVIDAVYLPSTFAGFADLGLSYHHAGGAYLNSLVDDVRFSSVVRSAVEILADYNSSVPLPVDSYTTAKYNFDNNVLPEQVQLPAVATFVRPSLAYKLDGTQVNANQPVYETGKFGQAVTAEEGTLNLTYNLTGSGYSYLYSQMTSVPSDYTIQSGSYLEYDIRLPAGSAPELRMAPDFTTSDGFTLRDSGAVDQNNVSAHPNVDLTAYAAGKWYHRKIAIPSSLNNKLISYYDLVGYRSSGSATAINGMVRRIVITDGAGTVRKSVWVDTDAAPTLNNRIINGSVTLNANKVGSNTLLVPVSVLPTAGTVEQWVYVNAEARRATGTAGRIFQINRGDGYSAGLVLYHDTSTAQWVLLTRNDIGFPDVQGYNFDRIYVNDTVYTPDGWHHFAVTWGAAGAKLYIDGVQRGTTISAVYLPTVFTGAVYVGQHYANQHYLNSLIDDLRISSVTRSDAEILADYSSGAALPVDAGTLAKLEFDGNLGGYIKQNRVEINLSTDGGTTWQGWQTAASGGAAPGIPVGTDLSNARLEYRATQFTNENWNINLNLASRTWAIVPVTQPTVAAAVYAGENYTVILKDDGTVWAWGDNQFGQLGQGFAGDKANPEPIQVPGLTGIVGIATGAYHVAALKNDGTVWTWGLNPNKNTDPDTDYGQLGRDSAVAPYTPTQVSGINGVTAIAAGIYHTLALKNDGTVWSWGCNLYYQLGFFPDSNLDSEPDYYYTNNPTQVEDPTDVTDGKLHNVVAIDAGGYHSMALKNDSTVWTWGNNIEGEAGDNSTATVKLYPTPVPGLTGVTAIAAGGSHNLAITNTGNIKAWGSNGYGQIGDGSAYFDGAMKTTPAQVYYDTTPPAIVSTTPNNNATNIPRRNPITVTFNEPINQGLITGDSFVVTDAVYGTAITGNVTTSVYGATFTPTVSYGLGSTIKVVFKPGVKDLVGNVVYNSYIWTFTATPDVNSPMCWVKINNDAPWANSNSVQLTLSSDDDSGVVSEMQLSNDGSDAPWIPYVGWPTLVNWELNPGDGLKTVYVRFKDPSNNATTSAYTDTIMVHTTPPNITGLEGTDTGGTVTLHTYDPVTVTFDENIQSSTAFNDITIKDSSDRNISLTRTISGNKLILTPANSLINNSSYQITIPSGAVTDMYANSLVQAWVYGFITEQDTVAPSLQAVPTGGTYNQETEVTLEATNEAVPPVIYYTTDGSDPVPGTSPVYTGPMMINTTTTLKYRAVDSYGNISGISTQQYIIDPSGPRIIGSSSIPPVIYNNKVVYGGLGSVRQYNLATGSDATVVSSVYNYAVRDYDPINGRVVFGYFEMPVDANYTRGLLVYDMVYDRVVADLSGGGISDSLGAIYGNTLVYYDYLNDSTKVIDFTYGPDMVIGIGKFGAADLSVNKLVYSDNRGIVMRDLNSGIETAIDSATNISNLRFSSDPNIVYWTEDSQTVNKQVYMYNVALGVKTPVVQGDHPYFDGRTVYYDFVTDTGSRHIFSKNLDTGTVTQYTYSDSYENNAEPVFGNPYLVYLKNHDLMLRDFNAGPPRITPSVVGAVPIDPNTPDSYIGPIDIELKSNKAGTDIYYTTNNQVPTDPAANAVKYTGPITANGDITLKYYGIDAQGRRSEVGTKQYTVSADTTPPVVTITPIGGTYTSLQTVTITANEEAKIYYTLDGTYVTTASPVYTQPITINSPTTLNFMAVDRAGNATAPVTQQYTVNILPPPSVDEVAPLVYSDLDSGTYPFAMSVTIGASEPSTIYYTTDGSAPSGLSPILNIGGQIPITNSTTLKFFGMDSAGNPSTIVTKKYLIAAPETVPPPVVDTVPPTVTASPAGGTYDSAQSVTLTANETATIYYTTDGSTPTVASPVYSGPIPVNANTTLRYYAVDSAGNASAVVSQNYIINVINPAPVTGPIGGGGTSGPAPTTMMVLDSTSNKQGGVVSKEGSLLQTTDTNVTIDVPKGAVAASIQLTVTPVNAADISATVVILGNQTPVSPTYEFGPTGTTFANPITITLKFDKTSLSPTDVIAPYYLNEQTGQWELMPNFTVNWENNSVSFTTSHFSKYALMVSKKFDDIKNHWAKTVIEDLVKKGIVSGKTDRLFAPDNKITRAEFARMLVGAVGIGLKDGKRTFADVDEKAWYYRWVETAYEAGIIAGSKGRFRPNDLVSRQEMAAMVVKALAYRQKHLDGTGESLAAFADRDKVAGWAQPALAKAVKAKLINGRGAGRLAPLDNATRAESAALVKKILDLVG